MGKSVHNVFGLACIFGLNQVLMPIFLRVRCGWIILEQTRSLRRFHFTTLFIEFVVVETKRFFSGNPNVILMRQTCVQRSIISAESKHWSLAFYNSTRIYHMFHVSKCRGRSDLGLCTTLVLVKTIQLQSVDFWLKTVLGRKIRWNLPMPICILFASNEAVHRPKSDCTLPFDVWNIWQIRTQN